MHASRTHTRWAVDRDPVDGARVTRAPDRPWPRGGFSVVELVIAVAIAAILAAMGAARYTQVRERAVVAVMESDLHNLVVAEEVWAFEHGGEYVAALDSLRPSFRPSTDVDINVTLVTPQWWIATAHTVGIASRCTVAVFPGSSAGSGLATCAATPADSVAAVKK